MIVHVRTNDDDRTLHLGNHGGVRTVSDHLRKAGMPLNTRCAGRGLCDGCRVGLTSGRLIHTATGDQVNANGQAILLRACEHRFDGGEVTLTVPDRSLTRYRPQVLTDFQLAVPCGRAPIHGRNEGLGIAIDIGTTTVALVLVDLASGAVLGQAAGFNRQIDYGDDVLTRINLCLVNPNMIGRMQEALVNETLAPLMDQAITAANVKRQDLAVLTATGNSTMLHLLAGVNPASMGLYPFTPTFLEHRTMALSELDFRWPGEHSTDPRLAQVMVHLMPGAAAYVGADIMAGAVASSMAYDPGPALLVDVGTNGEILLKLGDQLTGCATAAGPAFEGSRLADGMRAGDGAVAHIQFDPDSWQITCQVIGGGQPAGLCGSAYVDFLAEGARHGFLLPGARFNPDHPAMAHLVRQLNCHANCFAVAKRRDGQAICVTEADLASLLQAKAAIAAGIMTLLRNKGLTPADVKTLYLAGGFGMHMNTANAIRCGLLPGFTLDQVKLVGNSALAGAFAALIDRGLLDEMKHTADRTTIVELNLEPGFEDCFIDHLTLEVEQAETV
ncbi:MAG: ASKHA domain-containing protein [Phycisphaeraceae bacterium]